MINRKKVHKESTKLAMVTWGWRLFDWSIIVAFIIILFIGFVAQGSQPSNRLIQHKQFRSESRGAISIQVVNGLGESRILAKIVNRLMQEGFDVVDVKKKSPNIHPYTLLLDRKGNCAKTDTIAKVCGLDSDRIIIQRNEQIFDATLIIGKDYKFSLQKLLIER